jgi:1-acyl-sn-glycerol-3-phosphate acyltransferase
MNKEGQLEKEHRGLVYWFCRTTVKYVSKYAFRLRMTGLEYIPSQGPTIIACNHIHNFDPPFIGSHLPRYIHFMAKSELFNNRLSSLFMHALGAFPVRRGGQDKAAIRKAIEYTKHGCLLVFPEGHRSKDGTLGEPQPGIAFIARKANCPIVPLVIIGPYRFLRPISVRIGAPIGITPEDTNDTVLQKLMENLQRLLSEGPIVNG